MLTCERTGGRLAEVARKTDEDEIPFSSCSDLNPFAAKSLQTETVSTPVQQQDPFPSNLLDLLTGEDSSSDPFPQPAVECIASGGNDMLDFLDQAVVEYGGSETVPGGSFPQDKSLRESGSHMYLNCLKSLVGPNVVCYFILTNLTWRGKMVSGDDYFVSQTLVLIDSFLGLAILLTCYLPS